MAEVERISMTIERGLLERLDRHVALGGHANRSEAIRDLIRRGLVESATSDAMVGGSLTLVYDHRQRELSDRLVDEAHQHHDLVVSTMHVHLDRDHCMEISALRGTEADLRHYARHVLGMKGVLHGELVVTLPGGVGDLAAASVG